MQVPEELVRLHQSLTDTDKEDWLIVPDGKQLYITCMQEIEGTAQGMQFITRFDDFKAMARVPQLRGRLGCVILTLPTDAAEAGSMYLVGWLQRLAKRRGFNVLLWFGELSTAEAVAAWRDYRLRHARPAGTS